MNRLTGRLTAALEAHASRSFHVGDHVSWNSEAGHVSGRIVKVHTKPFTVNGYTHHASPESPQYEIKSSKTDHVAFHKAGSLHHLSSSTEAKKEHGSPDLWPAGTEVHFNYRGFSGTGVVEGVHERGTTHANTMYTVRPHKTHPGGPKLIHRTGAHLRKVG